MSRFSGLKERTALPLTIPEELRVPPSKVRGEHMEELRRFFGGRCQNPKCAEWRGPRGRLEFAHVKPTALSGRGRGLRRRYFDVLLNPDCYQLLCRRCHHRIDLEHWTRMAAAAPAPTVDEDVVPF